MSEPTAPTPTPADLLPSLSKDPAANRRIVTSSLIVLVALILLTTFVAFRSDPSVNSKVSAATPLNVPPAVVSITRNGFSPSTVSIKVGQAVIWTDNDTSPHFVIADAPRPINPNDPSPNSEHALGPSDSYSYVFDQAGSYGYHDTRNPDFKGTVEVK